MGMCMWNTGITEIMDYGQMGITEDYLIGSYSCTVFSLIITYSYFSLLVPCSVWTSTCILPFLPPVLM